jgi:hypothetical protein
MTSLRLRLFLTTLFLSLFLALGGCASPDFVADEGADPGPDNVAATGGAPNHGGSTEEPNPAADIDRDMDEGADDALVTPPLGDNPAMDYGPYDVEILTVRVADEHEVERDSAYFFVPKGADLKGPLPTIVWGHGMMSAFHPEGQQEVFLRQASKGYLVIYPNMEVPIDFWNHNILLSVVTYLNAARKAVDLGVADPDRIIFGGYSMGGRVAALATAVTTGLDTADFWPDPVACVYEAMRDHGGDDGGAEIGIPGPQPSDWAYMIAKSIPQTVIVAEEDRINPTTAPNGGLRNGAFFFRQLPSEFAQLITLKSGSTRQDVASHDTFHAASTDTMDVLDFWGHLKIVAGITTFHFAHGSREWAYGLMRTVGGLDSAGHAILHEVVELEELQEEPPPQEPAGPGETDR